MMHWNVTDERVTFISYPKLIYAAPLITAGFLFWPLETLGVLSPGVLGWTYSALLLYTVLTPSIDLRRNIFLAIMAVAVIIMLAASLIQATMTWRAFDDLVTAVSQPMPLYNRESAWLVSKWLLIPYMLCLVWSWLNSRWVLSANYIERLKFMDESWQHPQTGLTVKIVYPDWLQLLFCGAGDIHFLSIQDEREYTVAVAENIPFLFFLQGRVRSVIERMGFHINN
jgi:hypothetical protein